MSHKQATGIVGDFKFGFQASDHIGWIKLDGRLKTALTVPQQNAATALGIGANLPNIADKAPVGVSGTKTLGTTGGAATATIGQTHLPNINLSGGSHSHGVSDPGHTHTLSPAGFWYFSGTIRIGTGGIYGAEAAGSIASATTGISINASGALSIPLGGSGTALPIQNPYLAMNAFIFLGS